MKSLWHFVRVQDMSKPAAKMTHLITSFHTSEVYWFLNSNKWTIPWIYIHTTHHPDLCILNKPLNGHNLSSFATECCQPLHHPTWMQFLAADWLVVMKLEANRSLSLLLILTSICDRCLVWWATGWGAGLTHHWYSSADLGLCLCGKSQFHTSFHWSKEDTP